MHKNYDNTIKHNGFTLIEISLSLIIIALLVGSILVGMDMLRAARIRSVVSAIDQYDAAVLTFKNKYGGIPGDIASDQASALGFPSGNGTTGQGNNNGLLEGINSNWMNLGMQQIGETAVFWRDLSQANLLKETFNIANFATANYSLLQIPNLYPTVPFSNPSQVMIVWISRNNGPSATPNPFYKPAYMFGQITSFTNATEGMANFNRSVTVTEAYMLDSKIDDGLPRTGKVNMRGEGAGPGSTYDAYNIDRGTNYCLLMWQNSYNTANADKAYCAPAIYTSW